MKLIHVELADANEYVAKLHRHHKPATGHRFSLGAEKDGALCGVAVVGRPVARKTDQRNVVEVLRCCTDGTPNACSFLYGAAARAAKALGYHKIQTFTLPEEGGASLRAAGWQLEARSPGGSWNVPSRSRVDSAPTTAKAKWSKLLVSAPDPSCYTQVYD